MLEKSEATIISSVIIKRSHPIFPSTSNPTFIYVAVLLRLFTLVYTLNATLRPYFPLSFDYILTYIPTLICFNLHSNGA